MFIRNGNFLQCICFYNKQDVSLYLYYIYQVFEAFKLCAFAIMLQWTSVTVLCIHLLKSTTQMMWYNLVKAKKKKSKIISSVLNASLPNLSHTFILYLFSILFHFFPFFNSLGHQQFHVRSLWLFWQYFHSFLLWSRNFFICPSVRNTFWMWWAARSSCCSQWKRWRGCSCLMMSMCLKRRPWWPHC